MYIITIPDSEMLIACDSISSIVECLISKVFFLQVEVSRLLKSFLGDISKI